MTAGRVLININQLHGRQAPFLQRLGDAGMELVMNTRGRLLTEEELIAALPGVFATMAGGEPYTERVFASAPGLRLVSRFGVGYDQVDVAAATRNTTLVTIGPGTNSEAVADYAFGLMIGLACDMMHNHNLTVAGGWSQSFHPGVWGRTVGIVGLGRIGRALAERCHGFRMRIVAHDPVPDHKFAAAHDIEFLPLHDLLSSADFVSLHAPLTPETRDLVGATELTLMKPTAYIINTARGALIDEHALHAALVDGTIAGAGIDAFASEPPAGSALLTLDNVFLSPHAAAMDARSEVAMANRCIDHILALLGGRSPPSTDVLNPEVVDRMGLSQG